KQGSPVEVPIGAQDQSRVGLGAVCARFQVAEAVKRRQRATRSDFEDRATVVGPAISSLRLEPDATDTGHLRPLRAVGRVACAPVFRLPLAKAGSKILVGCRSSHLTEDGFVRPLTGLGK